MPPQAPPRPIRREDGRGGSTRAGEGQSPAAPAAVRQPIEQPLADLVLRRLCTASRSSSSRRSESPARPAVPGRRGSVRRGAGSARWAPASRRCRPGSPRPATRRARKVELVQHRGQQRRRPRQPPARSSRATALPSPAFSAAASSSSQIPSSAASARRSAATGSASTSRSRLTPSLHAVSSSPTSTTRSASGSIPGGTGRSPTGAPARVGGALDLGVVAAPGGRVPPSNAATSTTAAAGSATARALTTRPGRAGTAPAPPRAARAARPGGKRCGTRPWRRARAGRPAPAPARPRARLRRGQVGARKRGRQVGHAAALAGQLLPQPLGQRQLRRRRQPRIQHLRGDGLLRRLARVAQVGGEHRREDEQPDHDAAVAGGDRPAAVQRAGHPVVQRHRGERVDGEPQAQAHQRLRRQRPPRRRPRQQRECRQPSRDGDGPRHSLQRVPARAARASGPAVRAASGITVTMGAASAGERRQPSTSSSTSRNSAAVSAAEISPAPRWPPRAGGRREARDRGRAGMADARPAPWAPRPAPAGSGR